MKRYRYRCRAFEESAVYSGDPLARLLLDRLRWRPQTMALAGLAWGVFYLLVLPAVLGALQSRDGYLGSLEDWHAQILMLLVFPAVSAFYIWQPRAIGSVYEAMQLRWALLEVGRGYRSRVWLGLSISLALGVVLFDGPKMVANYGSWWMTENWATILGREASLAVAFYMLSTMAWRQLVATLEWRRLLTSRAAAGGLRAASTYGLSWALLLALLGLRLSIEGIELPHRAGSITPDYYGKVFVYLVSSVVCFVAPLWGAFRRDSIISLERVVVLLQLVGIVSLPLLGFVLLKLVLSP